MTALNMWGIFNWERRVHHSRWLPIDLAIDTVVKSLQISPITARALLNKFKGILWEIISNEAANKAGDPRGRKPKGYKAVVRAIGSDHVHKNLGVQELASTVLEIPSYRLRGKRGREGQVKRRAFLLASVINSLEEKPISKLSIRDITSVGLSTVTRYKRFRFWRTTEHFANLNYVCDPRLYDEFVQENQHVGVFRNHKGGISKQIGNSYRIWIAKRFRRAASRNAKRASKSVKGSLFSRTPRLYFRSSLEWFKYRKSKAGSGAVGGWAYFYQDAKWRAICSADMMFGSELRLLE